MFRIFSRTKFLFHYHTFSITKRVLEGIQQGIELQANRTTRIEDQLSEIQSILQKVRNWQQFGQYCILCRMEMIFCHIFSVNAMNILSFVGYGPTGHPDYYPEGPQTNVALSTVLSGGWSKCYSETYDKKMLGRTFERIRDRHCTGTKARILFFSTLNSGFLFVQN